MTRRDALKASAAAALVPVAAHTAPASAGRLKQSLARWCYAKIPIDDLCRAAAGMGITGMDLVAPEDWPVLRKYGITPSMVQGAGTFNSGWNRKENHDRLTRQMEDSIVQAAEAKVPNVITLAGSRTGVSDDEGKQNCIEGLRRVKKIAEDHGVTICMELLNSKRNHKDYMCDHTAWGVAVCEQVDSPRVKLLYDIYHMQIMEGDLVATIKENIKWLGHFHTGGVPGRHELDDTQEVNWAAVMRGIASTGFTGYVAHEFVPARDPLTSLREAVDICDI